MNLIDQLKRDEGEVLHVYLDSRGIRTAGVGHNLVFHNIDFAVGTPITQEKCDQMTFNLGINGLLAFVHTLDWIKRGDYAMAALGMLHSAWATQVGDRAQRLAKQMETGEWA